MNLEENKKWVERDKKVVATCSRIRYYPFVMESGKGSIVKDVDGNEFIDMLSSAGALNLGHAHPEVVKTIQKVASEFTHYTTAYFYNKYATELAERICEALPGDFDKKVAFGLTGSDSNDGAIKFARGYTGRSKIVVFKNSYHGATYGAIALTHISSNMRRKIGPFMPDIFAFDFPNTYKNGPEDGKRCIKSIKDGFNSYCPADEVAAVIIECIQGDAGIIVPPKEFIQELHALCKENGILFIAEEVQQGYMRTGKMFSFEHFDIIPDLVILAKPMGGGMPLSAVAGRADVMESLDAPAHVFTFSGNPVSCAAGITTIDIINTPEFQNHVNEMGSFMEAGFKKLAEKYDCIGDIRGYGLSYGVEIVKDRATKENDSIAATKFIYQLWKKGVIMITLAGNVLRVQPPLIITKEEIQKVLDIMDEAFDDLKNNRISDEALEVIAGW